MIHLVNWPLCKILNVEYSDPFCCVGERRYRVQSSLCISDTLLSTQHVLSSSQQGRREIVLFQSFGEDPEADHEDDLRVGPKENYFSKYNSLVKGIRIMKILSPFSRPTESSYLELEPWSLHLGSFHTSHLPPPENSNTGKFEHGLAEQVWTLNTKCPAFKSSLHPIQAV